MAQGGFMTKLDGFRTYGGSFPTTASLSNALAYQGVTAPHTGKPYTEAMLMGIAGGCAFGYFTFAYDGYDPQANLLTRNTFHGYGWDLVTAGLGIQQDVRRSTTAEKGRQKLLEVLDQGYAPIVWADPLTLGYETHEFGEGMWQMSPMVVTAYEPGGEAILSDRAGRPITVPAEKLDEARGRVKKEKFRVVVIDTPEQTDLKSAARNGIRECIDLYDGSAPQGSGKNFGLGGYQQWIARLTNDGAKESWAKLFSAGRELFSGVTTAFKYGLLYWKDNSLTADRALFAGFLREASGVLDAPSLSEASEAFEQCGARWRELGNTLLPDRVEVLREARELLRRRHLTFLEHGTDKLDELHEIDRAFGTLKKRAETELSSPHDAAQLRQEIAEQVAAVHAAEEQAVLKLREARVVE